MSDLAERLISPISTAELERRWSAVRAAMAERGIDVLVMQNSNEFSGGYVKWFTDMPASNGTMTTVIFPKDDLMTVVGAGAVRGRRQAAAGRPGAARGQAVPGLAQLHGRLFTNTLDNANVEKALEEFSGATIGLVAQGSMGTRSSIIEARQARQREIRRRDRARRPHQGDQERRGDRADPRHRALQDRAMRAAFDGDRPGMRDIEIAAVAENYTRIAGTEYGLLMGASSRSAGGDDPAAPHPEPRHPRRRPVRPAGREHRPRRLLLELGRTCVLGKATQSMKDEFAFALEAQQFTATC